MALRLRTVLLVPAVAAGALLATGAANAGYLYTSAQCAGSSISVRWTLYGDPGGYPNFVGYDLYRRAQPECGLPVRLNAEILPRIPGQTHTVTFVDSTAATATMYRYDVALVDANHHGIIWQEFCDPCFSFAWESCPQFSAPLVQGTLESALPLWLSLWPCPGVDCYTHFYIERPWPPELEQYVGTGTAVRIYGPWSCANTEGCFIFGVVNFDVRPCGITAVEEPEAPGTWGAIKAAYR